MKHHVDQALPLIEAGLKILAFETVPAYQEILAILEALDQLPADVRCWISVACKVTH